MLKVEVEGGKGLTAGRERSDEGGECVRGREHTANGRAGGGAEAEGRDEVHRAEAGWRSVEGWR